MPNPLQGKARPHPPYEVKTLFIITTLDAETILGRHLRPGEDASIRKTLEGLNEDAVALIEAHGQQEVN